MEYPNFQVVYIVDFCFFRIVMQYVEIKIKFV